MSTSRHELEKKLNFITVITQAMLSSIELDEIIYIILSGITSGEGLGYNRAFLFLVDEGRLRVGCKMAIGPVGRLSAHQIWEDMYQKGIDLKNLLNSFRTKKDDVNAWKLTKIMSGFSLPVGKGRRTLEEKRSDVKWTDGKVCLEKLVQECIEKGVERGENKLVAYYKSQTPGEEIFFKNFVLVPLSGRRRKIGAIVADNYFTHRKIGSGDIESIKVVASLASVAIERAKLYRRMKSFAEVDGLSGLLNRRIFLKRLNSLVEDSVRRGREVSVLLMDIDDFKDINDRFGHLVGDDVIKKVSSILKGKLREGDFSCRYGGDEMVVALPETDIGGAISVASKILDGAGKIRLRGAGELKVGVSIGVSSTSLGYFKVKQLLASADKALYVAKSIGKGRIEVAAVRNQ